jgi:hypothetical protein
MNYTTSKGSVVPQSFITKGKQRLKQHIDTVYMNNGDEFEIELFNPTQNKVLAKIELNGKSIGSGIIVRPGERVFLERYFDEARKFLFETYVVNGDDENVQNAIQKNGDVIIKFYDQYYSNFDYTYSNIIYDNFNGTFTTLRSFNTTNTTSFNSNDTLCFSSLGDLKETGRVEKGSKSDQTFNTDSTIFNSFPTKSDWWKIKPNSTKVMVREDLVVYCTECGSKRKKDSYRYCPTCGTKY